MNTTAPHYGTLGPDSHDRDAERLLHDLQVARQRTFPETPQQLGHGFQEASRRMRLALGVLRHGALAH